MRVKTAVPRHRRIKRLKKATKGFHAGRRRLLRTMKDAIQRSMAQSYRGRKERKRQFRGVPRFLREERGQRDTERIGQLAEHGGRGARLFAFDQRDHRAADAAQIGEPVRRVAPRPAQFPDTPGEVGIDVHASSIWIVKF